ncbi:MAG: YihY/virulence factor BrkB family protein [Lachnospiraceae bacterium]|nr:YihY/virulence factor BrkB family protein [Lachnospiraceae bacterium]
MKEKVFKVYPKIRGFFAEASDKRIDIYSACAAFYIFMSFIPFVLILFSVIKYLPFSKDELLLFIDGFLPMDIGGVAAFVIEELYNRGIGVLSLSVIAALWASAKGTFGISKGLDEINGTRGLKNYFYIRARSALCTLMLLVVMVLFLVISVFGNTITSIVTSYVAIPDRIISLISVKNIVMFILLFLLFLFMFCVLPAGRVRIRSQIAGACGASFIWIGFTKLFSFYLSTFNGYSMYGGFAVVLVIGIWLYSGMYIMFMGALANRMIASRKGQDNEREDQ